MNKAQPSQQHPSYRGSIHVEEARILCHEAHAGGQYILRLESPRCAANAEAGSFSHIQCSGQLPMRRPLSIMRTNKEAGWVEYLYRDVGTGTHALAQRQVGEYLSVMGPIGRPFSASTGKRRPLLIGGGVGIPPMIFLAETLKQKGGLPLVLMGSEIAFPFATAHSRIELAGLPAAATAAIVQLEEIGVASRLASLQDFAGCFRGYVTDLARRYLETLTATELAEVELFACGPHPMLAASAKLAREFSLDCQLSLEEYMACAVGGCAGCVVKVHTDNGPAMKRVCVDGPVFDANQVFPAD